MSVKRNFINERIEDIKDSIAFFSNDLKPEREKWVVNRLPLECGQILQLPPNGFSDLVYRYFIWRLENSQVQSCKQMLLLSIYPGNILDSVLASIRLMLRLKQMEKIIPGLISKARLIFITQDYCFMQGWFSRNKIV